MRGVEKVVTTRTYHSDVHWLSGVAAKLSANSGRKYGAADAIRWGREEIERLQQQVSYIEIDRASMLRKVNEMSRKMKVSSV